MRKNDSLPEADGSFTLLSGRDPWESARYVAAYLKTLQEKQKITVLVTTHLMEEAELCDRLAILHQGNLVAVGKPEELKRHVGGDIIEIQATDSVKLSEKIKEKFQLNVSCQDSGLLIEHPHAAEFVPKLASSFFGEIISMTLRKPSLGDVFMHLTGRRFSNQEV